MVYKTQRSLQDIYPPEKYSIEEISRNREGGRITHKVTDKATKKAFVIKQFRFANSSDWSGLEFHEREIRALMKLHHPAIPRLLETHETDDGFLLVQEYVNATSLSTQICNRVFTQAEVRAITTSLLLILQYVHEKGHLCHGDVQPGNVLVDLSGGISVYLIDFGLARSSGDSVVVSTALGGTPGFTAPDQVLNRRAEAHGDIYGVAVIAMCLLTGKDPGDIASLRDSRTFRYSYRELLKGAAPAPPEYFLKWIDKCVSPNSADRYQSARVAHEALKASEGRYQKARTVRWWLAPPLGLLLGTIIVVGFWRHQAWTISKQMAELAELEAQSKAQLSAAEERAEQRRQEELKRQEEERKRREAAAAQVILDQRQRNVEQLLQTRSCPGCDLREVDLSRLDLEGVDLRDADLSRAKLEAMRLVGANLAGAVLTEANLSDSNISNANFSGAYMEGAQLQRVNGSEAVFQGAVLTHTNFGSGILPGSTFVSADLSDADLGNAEFEGANFEMANLDGTFTFFTSFRDARMPNGFER